jgi:hypothetical protein
MKKIVDKEQKGQKKPYHSPRLFTFGEVANLTQKNGLGPISDSGNNAMAIMASA